MAGVGGGTRVHRSLGKTGSKVDKAQDEGLGNRPGETLRAQEGKGIWGSTPGAPPTPAVSQWPGASAGRAVSRGSIPTRLTSQGKSKRIKLLPSRWSSDAGDSIAHLLAFL